MRTLFLINAFSLIAGIGVLTAESHVLSTVTRFEDFLKILAHIQNFSERLRFIQAVWGEVRADYSDDLEKATLLYQQFDGLISSKIAIEAQSAQELKQEIRRFLRNKNAELLIKAWNGEEFPRTTELLKFCAYLKDNYEVELVQEIYDTAIDEIFPQRSADVLAAFFAQIYVHGDKASFELMLHTQLHLYWKFVNEQHVNDAYHLNVGNYFHQAQNDALYDKLDNGYKRRLTKAIDALPSTVQTFFFDDSFCLKNRGKSQYLLSRDNTDIDEDRRYVQTVSPAPTNDTAIWLREFARGTGNRKGVPDQKFWLKSKGLFMFMDQSLPKQLDLVVSWRGSSLKVPETRTWTLKMIGDALIFTQNGFVMCASREKFDEFGFLVYGYQDFRYTPTNADCQWLIEKC